MPRFLEYMVEKPRSDTLSQMRGTCSHRLDFTMRRVQLLQRAAPKKLVAVPCRPKCNVGLAQPVEIERVHAFRRRVQRHVAEMLAQQRMDQGTGQVVYRN